MRERDAWLALLNGWGMPDGWTGRDFFARWIALDPTWRDDNVWVAEDAGRFVSAVQIFPREALSAAYSSARSGTLIRDAALWEASFDLAGNPIEDVAVAHRGGELVAYLRLTRMSDKLVATEFAHRGDAEPLAALIEDGLRGREPDLLVAAEQSSETLRESMLLPALDDLALIGCLERRGIAAQRVDHPESMLQCLDLGALSARLDVSHDPDETPGEFLRRVLPPERFVFWPADRF